MQRLVLLFFVLLRAEESGLSDHSISIFGIYNFMLYTRINNILGVIMAEEWVLELRG